MMALALLVGTAPAQARSLSAGRIAIVGDHPLRLHIQTSASVSPQVQVVPNPERLVIDLPNTTAGAGFHGFAVRKGEIRAVRTSIFSTSPLVTRVVVDLNSPQWYQVAPDSTGLLITLGNDHESGDQGEATIGWVSTRSRSQSVSLERRAVTVKALATPPPATVNGVNVQFAKGQLSIQATNASLSEVLYQIQKKTGAEIAIPAGTEQERVAGDFGPASPNDVLTELLNGSQLNFVVIGSDADRNVLRSVILSRKGADADPPARFAQTNTSQPTAEEIPAENPEPAAAAVPLPHQEPIPANGPPPEPPQD
jgi:hypothetical protein